MLSESQVKSYRDNGFLSPLTAMSGEQALVYRTRLESFEQGLGATLPRGEAMFRYKTHLLLPWVADLVRNSHILDAVQSVVGPDILCWTCTWFIKEPNSEALTLPHQDATYFGLRPHEHITAWLALSDANEANGCMRFEAQSHLDGQLAHIARADPNSINGGGQRVSREFNLDRSTPIILQAGQFSLHHTLCLHTSLANTSNDRRIGLGISYVPAHVKHIGSLKMPATLVRGSDQYNHFELEPHPLEGQADLAHQHHYRRYREGYNEQVEWHARGRGWQEAQS